MRIAFDGTSLRRGRSGAATYGEQLLRHLVNHGPAHDVVVLANGPVTVTRRLRHPVRVAGGWPVPRALWLHAVAPWLAWRCDPDVTHFTTGVVPWIRSGPTVVTVRDLGLIRQPDVYSPGRVWLERPLLELALRQADAIIVPSQSVRTDIGRHHAAATDRIHVVAEAAAPDCSPVQDIGWLESVRRRYILADRIILFVGTIGQRKNLPVLLEAFAERARTGDLPHQLVCVGPYGWRSRQIEEQVERLGIEGLVRFTGSVPAADLPALYNLAEMLVQPSSYEGFGLTVLEAMACGTPTIVGPAAALTELAGGAAFALEAPVAESIGDAMVQLARSRAHRERLVALGRQRAAGYSWTRTTRETLAVYARAWRGAPRTARTADTTPLEHGRSPVTPTPTRHSSG